MAVSLQGDLLMTLVDKSLPTLIGLAGDTLPQAPLRILFNRFVLCVWGDGVSCHLIVNEALSCKQCTS